MAKVLVMFVEVNLSVPTSLTIPTEARYLRRRPRSGISTEAYLIPLCCKLAYQVVSALPESLDGADPQ